MQATQAELQRRNQELEAVRDELEQQVADRTAELSRREAFLVSIYHGVAQTLFVVDVTETRDFRYVSFNPLAEQLIGRPTQALQDKTPEEAFGATLGNCFRQNYERCLQSGTSITYEEHVTFEDRTLWALTTLSPLRNAEGTIYQIVGTAVDISDRKQTEAALRESEALYRMLFNSIDEGVCLVERLPLRSDGLRDYRYLALNPAMQAMFGIPDLSGQSIRENFPDEVEEWYDDYDRVLETGEAIRFERESEPQGMVLEMFVTRIEDESGQRLLAVMQNVTDRKRAEAAIAADLRDTQQLHDLSTRLTTETDIQVLYDEILATAIALVHADAGTVQLFEPTSQELVLLASEGIDQSMTDYFHHVSAGCHTSCGIALSRGDRTFVDFDVPEGEDPDGIYQMHVNAGYLLAQSTPLVTRSGKFLGMVSTHWRNHHRPSDRELRFLDLLARQAADLIEQRQAETALHENEQLLRLIMAGAQAGYWDWVLATGQLTWSAETYRLYGLDPTLLPNYDDWYNSLHPDDRTLVNDSVNQVIAQRQPDFQLEFRILHPQHGIRWILSLGHLTVNEQGEPVQLSGINLDFSDRRQAEAKLRESEQQYRSLFESINQGFCLLEVLFDANDKAIDYRFREINKAFEQQSGLANAVGKTILELVPNLEPQWAELYGQVAKSGESVRFEADVPSMNRIFDIYAFPSGTPGQNFVAVLFTDITQRKRAEAILQRTADVNAFRVSLADALRPLTNASEIQAIAARILGEALRATRVVYIEVVSGGEDVIVQCNYTHGVAELSGRYRLENYRRNLIADHQAGYPQVVTDIPNNPRYTDAEKARYRELDVAAHIDVPLMRNNQFVALLAVHQSTPRQWTETEVKLVEETAERTWAAVERAYAEAALRQNEEILRLALVGAQAGSWDWVLATGQLTWSPETYRLYGLDPTTPPEYGGWYENYLHPDDRTLVNDSMNQVIAQRQPNFQLEFRILHPQHGIRWILSLGHLMVNEQGEPVRLSGINLDISDRKQAEQKIREQAALLDIATDAILVCDLGNTILYWNQGAERLYGWQAEEALGKKASELLSTNPAEIAEMMQTVLAQGEWRGELHRVTQTGREVIVEGRWTLVRDEAEQPKSILSVDTDITEKKNLEAQFYHAQRLESLGTLTSGIAHDLNNALTPILTIAQLLRFKYPGLDARSQEMLQVLEDSAKRGANMVQQILTFTRGTGGERTPIEVASLLQETVKVVQQTLPKLIKIRAIVPAQGVRQVSADTTQLHQVLMNLCVNARDAMPKGGTLTLSVENFEANEVFVQMNLDARVGQYVLITVSDTGTGISPEVRDRIFDPFFTTKALGQGTGLGLSTVLGIVRSYGGFIQVASEVGRGTQFKVYLPAIETEAASNLQETRLPSGQGELILVVDDEDPILQSTRVILETHHYQVLTASTGEEAIAIYAQHPQEIAVVLVDMMMPDIDGLTVIRVLQKMNPQVRAIAVSGLLPQYQPSLKTLGINIFLNKPYTTEDLLNSLHLQLGSDE